MKYFYCINIYIYIIYTICILRVNYEYINYINKTNYNIAITQNNINKRDKNGHLLLFGIIIKTKIVKFKT